MAIRSLAASISTISLIVREISAGSGWHRIFLDGYSDPLGYGVAPSRFSLPPLVGGVCYLGETFADAFVETLVRDRRNLHPSVLVVPLNELAGRAHVLVTVMQPLNVVDLRGDNLVRMGIPTDAVRAQSHRLGQQLSLALYRHSDGVDGIFYSSRLSEAGNLAIFHRAMFKLRAGPRRRLDRCTELAVVLDRYQIAVV